MRYIGNELKKRMELLGIDVPALAEMTFLSTDIINDMLNNRIAAEEIDEFGMSLICGALHCEAGYFVDSEVRKKDLLFSTANKEKDTVKSETIKAKIQNFMNDYAFVNGVLKEMG